VKSRSLSYPGLNRYYRVVADRRTDRPNDDSYVLSRVETAVVQCWSNNLRITSNKFAFNCLG